MQHLKDWFYNTPSSAGSDILKFSFMVEEALTQRDVLKSRLSGNLGSSTFDVFHSDVFGDREAFANSVEMQLVDYANEKPKEFDFGYLLHDNNPQAVYLDGEWRLKCSGVDYDGVISLTIPEYLQRLGHSMQIPSSVVIKQGIRFNP